MGRADRGPTSSRARRLPASRLVDREPRAVQPAARRRCCRRLASGTPRSPWTAPGASMRRPEAADTPRSPDHRVSAAVAVPGATGARRAGRPTSDRTRRCDAPSIVSSTRVVCRMPFGAPTSKAAGPATSTRTLVRQTGAPSPPLHPPQGHCRGRGPRPRHRRDDGPPAPVGAVPADRAVSTRRRRRISSVPAGSL